MILALVLSALSALPQPEDPPPTAFVGARIHTVNGPPIEDGTLIVVGSKIVAVGPASETAAPAGAKIIDASGKTIIPGLICTHSHLGGTAGADGSGPIQPDVRVSDSLNVRDSGYRRALAGGAHHPQLHARLGAPAQRPDRLPEASPRPTPSRTCSSSTRTGSPWAG